MLSLLLFSVVLDEVIEFIEIHEKMQLVESIFVTKKKDFGILPSLDEEPLKINMGKQQVDANAMNIKVKQEKYLI